MLRVKAVQSKWVCWKLTFNQLRQKIQAFWFRFVRVRRIRMRIFILFIILSFCFQATAQQTSEWLEMLENPKYSNDSLQRNDVKEEYSKYNFSTLLPNSDFLGFIGSNFQRIEIYYTQVARHHNDKMAYDVEGISLVGENKCDFKGQIRVVQIRKYQTMYLGPADEYKDEGLKAQGVLIGEYGFEENAHQKHSGIFKGIMTLKWFLDRHDILHSNYLEWGIDDGYYNNQYIGTWTEYGKTQSKVCNWGECRIPFSGDLDVGASQFYPDPKYHKNGWESYVKLHPLF